MITYYNRRWDEVATSFMNKQGRFRRAQGTHYFAGTANRNIFFLYSVPRRRGEWAEVNAFSDWKQLNRCNLDREQKKKVREYGIYLGMIWVFESLDNEGIWGRVEQSNRAIYQMMLSISATVVPTDKMSPIGEPYFEWRYTREQFRNSDIYQRAKDAVYDF